MITKEQALEAVDILDRLVGLKPVGFSNARKILRQFIEQQPVCDKPETSNCISTAPCAFCPHK